MEENRGKGKPQIVLGAVLIAFAVPSVAGLWSAFNAENSMELLGDIAGAAFCMLIWVFGVKLVISGKKNAEAFKNSAHYLYGTVLEHNEKMVKEGDRKFHVCEYVVQLDDGRQVRVQRPLVRVRGELVGGQVVDGERVRLLGHVDARGVEVVEWVEQEGEI